VVVRAYPERDTDIEYIVIEAEPRFFVIRRLLMKFRNPTTNDFVFNNVLTNTGLGEALWEFEPPAGTEVVDLVN
jgi:outer membrane lipoprotein-sorting protein